MRKASSRYRRPRFPSLPGLIGLLLWCVSPLDAQPVSGEEHRSNLQEMIALIDAREILFAEDGEDLGVFYPDEIGADRLPAALIATQVVRDRLQEELDALEAAASSRNPTSLIPESRPHREPPPVDWEVEGISEKERCDTVRERLARLEAEEARLKRELTDREEALRPAREALERLDAEAEGDFAVSAVKISLTGALAVGKVPEKHVPRVESVLAPGKSAQLDQYIRDASTACSHTALSGMVEVLTDYGWACDLMPSPGSLSDVFERVPKRLALTKKHDVPRREQELLESEREAEDVSDRIRADLMTANSLGCPDVFAVPDPPTAEELEGRYLVEWPSGFSAMEFYWEHNRNGDLGLTGVDCSTSPCPVTAYLKAPFAGNCSLVGTLDGDRLALRTPNEFACPGDTSIGKGWELEATVAIGGSVISGSFVYTRTDGQREGGSFTAKKAGP